MKSNANNDRQLYLLTGAAGFLGSHICEELLNRGDRVRALVLRNDPSVKYIPREVEIVEGDLCDVRDLAHGCIRAADVGRKGACYILGNKKVTMKQMRDMLKEESHCKTPYFYLPLNLAYKMAASMEKKAKMSGKKPLMTHFSVYNLDRNNTFDYSKAERELGYHTRPYAETLHDMAGWLKEQGKIKA